MKTNEKCYLCGKELKRRHHNHKYCGKYWKKGTCAWIVARLQRKLIGIKERCLNTQHKNYRTYKHCLIHKEWLRDSHSFVVWAYSNGWTSGLTIDRKNNKRGYTPKNCRFVSMSENCRNKTNAVTDWNKKTRKCRVCKKIKSFSDFAISRKEVGGIAYECKICRKEIDRIRWRNQDANTPQNP